MCVAAIAHRAHPRWHLVVVANRDENHLRPTDDLARWTDGSGTLAGRDRLSGGTWLGVTPRSAEAPGRMVLVTNFRAPGYPQAHRPSRGELVRALLAGEAEPAAVPLAAYNPLNLAMIAGDAGHILTNHPAERRIAMAPGIHGLSNGAIDRPWPKVRQLCDDLADWLTAGSADPAPLLAALARREPVVREGEWDPAGTDPDPGHAPVFVANPVYGTRASSVVLVDADGAGLFVERRWDAGGAITGETTLAFAW